jgi:hypothetical protein
MKKIIFSILFLAAVAMLSAQDSTICCCNRWQASISISQNAANLGNAFVAPLHPGITVGANVRLNKNTKHQVFETFKVGYLYHQYIQHAIQAYSEIGYKYKADAGYAVAAMIGGGYVHSISDLPTFEMDANGVYKRVNNAVNPNYMITLGATAGYDLSKIGLPMSAFVGYGFTAQAVFIRQTSPLIAYSQARIGVAIPFSTWCK